MWAVQGRSYPLWGKDGRGTGKRVTDLAREKLCLIRRHELSLSILEFGFPISAREMIVLPLMDTTLRCV